MKCNACGLFRVLGADGRCTACYRAGKPFAATALVQDGRGEVNRPGTAAYSFPARVIKF